MPTLAPCALQDLTARVEIQELLHAQPATYVLLVPNLLHSILVR